MITWGLNVYMRTCVWFTKMQDRYVHTQMKQRVVNTLFALFISLLLFFLLNHKYIYRKKI